MKQKAIPGAIYRLNTNDVDFQDINGSIYQVDSHGILRGLSRKYRFSSQGFTPLTAKDFQIWDIDSLSWLPIQEELPSLEKGALYRIDSEVYVAVDSQALRNMNSGYTLSLENVWENLQKWDTEDMVWGMAFSSKPVN